MDPPLSIQTPFLSLLVRELHPVPIKMNKEQALRQHQPSSGLLAVSEEKSAPGIASMVGYALLWVPFHMGLQVEHSLYFILGS